MTESWMPSEHDFENFFSLPVKSNAADGCDEGIIKTLAKLVLLYDVPFSYLVPFELCLGENQTRFFYLDPNWIKAMMDGAMSIGRDAGIDYVHDTVFINEVYNRTLDAADNVRPELQGVLRSGYKSGLYAAECTGFLMRSPMVRGWRGLEFKAYGDDGELRALRIETLSDEVLLGLYRGVIKRLDVLEPPEGLHYGFNRDADTGKLTKTMRKLENGELFDKTAIVFERQKRVIDFAATADSIGDALGCKVTSAHIAVELIQNPYMLNFKLEK